MPYISLNINSNYPCSPSGKQYIRFPVSRQISGNLFSTYKETVMNVQGSHYLQNLCSIDRRIKTRIRFYLFALEEVRHDHVQAPFSGFYKEVKHCCIEAVMEDTHVHTREEKTPQSVSNSDPNCSNLSASASKSRTKAWLTDPSSSLACICLLPNHRPFINSMHFRASFLSLNLTKITP